MKAPGPSGVLLLGVLPWLIRDPAGLCAGAQRAYGPVVRLPVLRGAIYLLTEPERVEHVLVDRNRNHWKGRLFNRADFLFGRGLVLADGQQWQRQRRLARPAFGQERVARLVPTLVGVIERRAERWEQACGRGGVVEMEAEMMATWSASGPQSASARASASRSRRSASSYLPCSRRRLPRAACVWIRSRRRRGEGLGVAVRRTASR